MTSTPSTSCSSNSTPPIVTAISSLSSSSSPLSSPSPVHPSLPLSLILLLHLPLLHLSSSTSSSVQLQQQVLQGLQADSRVPQLGGQEEEASVLGHGAQREPLMELSNTQSIGLVLGQTDTPLTWVAPESLQVL